MVEIREWSAFGATSRFRDLHGDNDLAGPWTVGNWIDGHLEHENPELTIA